MADGSGRRRKKTVRSRTSCLECRKNHRKCDENRPKCTRCQRLQQQCTYGLRISWRRPLSADSNFGQFFANTEKDLPTLHSQNDNGQETECVGTRKTHNSRRPLPAYQEFLPLQVEHTSFFPGLSPAHMSLLGHFIHVADLFSCNQDIKTQFCGVFIPLAMGSCSVMTSVLTLAAVHRANNTTLTQNGAELGSLQFESIQRLRLSLLKPPDEPTIAAALMLCYADVVSGGSNGSSWRVHLEGTASLFAVDSSSWSIDSPNQSRGFLARCFVSLVAIAHVSSHPPTNAVSQQALVMIGRGAACHNIDSFTAYSTELACVFFEIGKLLRERRRATATPMTSSKNAELEQRSLHMLQHLTNTTTSHTGMTANNPHHYGINELFHLAAMVHIHQRIRGLLPSSMEIQQLTTRMLSLLSEIKLPKGPSTGILLYFPAFSAGAAAVNNSHRQQIRDILIGLVLNMGFVNLRQGLNVLEALWAHRDQHGESDSNASWEDFIQEGVDIILY